MEIFTDTEKRILEATAKRYKWIARDRDGRLCIYDEKPYRNEFDRVFKMKFGICNLFNKCVSDVLFKNVTWENSPIQYRDELLTPKEREYLKLVFKPFASNIMYVQKVQSNNIEYIKANTYSSAIVFPDSKEGTMYERMKPETKYTLKELGIEYDE